ncbi:MAG: tetratricopeptide repeat protein [Deltaproteobacteria bacterium]|nr:tetratricopeptide repeat protein [Deltaproteobacteria bacterium]
MLPCVFGGCAGEETTRRNAKLSMWHYRLGNDYLGKKKPEMAKGELLRALRYSEKNGEAHALLGVILFYEGVHAMNFIDRRQCIKGDAAEDQRRNANDVFRQSQKHLKRRIELKQDGKSVDSETLNYLANVAMHFERFDDAIALTTKALSNMMYTGEHRAMSTRGQAYFKRGDLKKAARDLRQAVFRQPKFCQARYWLAKTLHKQGKVGAAVRQLETLLKDKACPLQEAFQLLGLCYLKQRDPGKARGLFEQCVTSNPKSCVSQECRRYAKLM